MYAEKIKEEANKKLPKFQTWDEAFLTAKT
jgi:hypothetical protein